MRYDDLEAAISELVGEAGEDELRVFGVETVTRLVRSELLDDAVDDDLDGDAWAALTSARETVRTADAAELRAQLTRIDAGILADGDLDQGILIVVGALEHWTTYLEEGRRESSTSWPSAPSRRSTSRSRPTSTTSSRPRRWPPSTSGSGACSPPASDRRPRRDLSNGVASAQ
ncbi:hypothetical protein NKG94_19940 [Micromonospora sp. M12]